MSEAFNSGLVDFGFEATFGEMLENIIRTDRHFCDETGNGFKISQEYDLVDLETRDDLLVTHYTPRYEVHNAILSVAHQSHYAQQIIDDLLVKYPVEKFLDSYPTSAVLTHIFNDYFSSYRTPEEDTLFEGDNL